MQGERVERLSLTTGGAAGDRLYGVIDKETGKVLSAKRWAALLDARAVRDDQSGDVTITLPDGATLAAGDPATDDALSAWLDHDVRLGGPDPDAALAYELLMDPIDDSLGGVGLRHAGRGRSSTSPPPTCSPPRASPPRPPPAPRPTGRSTGSAPRPSSTPAKPTGSSKTRGSEARSGAAPPRSPSSWPRPAAGCRPGPAGERSRPRHGDQPRAARPPRQQPRRLRVDRRRRHRRGRRPRHARFDRAVNSRSTLWAHAQGRRTPPHRPPHLPGQAPRGRPGGLHPPPRPRRWSTSGTTSRCSAASPTRSLDERVPLIELPEPRHLQRLLPDARSPASGS